MPDGCRAAHARAVGSVRAGHLGAGHRPPAKVGLAGRRRLVEPADGRGMRRGLDESGVLVGLVGDRDQGIGERVERLDRFRLGRLDQHPSSTVSGK